MRAFLLLPALLSRLVRLAELDEDIQYHRDQPRDRRGADHADGGLPALRAKAEDYDGREEGGHPAADVFPADTYYRGVNVEAHRTGGVEQEVPGAPAREPHRRPLRRPLHLPKSGSPLRLRTSENAQNANFAVTEFYEVRLSPLLGSSSKKFQTSLIWGMRLVALLARLGAVVDTAGLITLPFLERGTSRWPRPIIGACLRQRRVR